MNIDIHAYTGQEQRGAPEAEHPLVNAPKPVTMSNKHSRQAQIFLQVRQCVCE